MRVLLFVFESVCISVRETELRTKYADEKHPGRDVKQHGARTPVAGAWDLCESRGRVGRPVFNSQYSLCGRKAASEAEVLSRCQLGEGSTGSQNKPSGTIQPLVELVRKGELSARDEALKMCYKFAAEKRVSGNGYWSPGHHLLLCNDP